MNNKDFNQQIAATSDFHQELNARLDKSKEIIYNLWRKHFHNFDVSPTEIFPWITDRNFYFQGQSVYLRHPKKASRPLHWRDKQTPINPVYYSNNVRAIASQARAEYYRVIKDRATQNKNDRSEKARTLKAELERLQKQIESNQSHWKQEDRMESRMMNIMQERRHKK